MGPTVGFSASICFIAQKQANLPHKPRFDTHRRGQECQQPFCPGQTFLLGGGSSFALVLFGVLLAQTLGLAACPLCIWQRILYLLFAVLAGIGFFCVKRNLPRRLLAFLMACAAATGGGIAGYQVWIQRFAPMTTCAGKEPWWEAFVRWAGEQLPMLFKASGLCSDPAWKFLDLSIADWSLLCFCGLFVLSFFAALQKQGRKKR